MRILVTGASGFVGQGLLRRLNADGRHQVRAAVRRPIPVTGRSVECIVVGDQSTSTEWLSALRGIDVVVALSARVHIKENDAERQLAQCREVNVGGTLNLAQQAVQQGVRRFVFISSIKVHGEGTVPSSTSAPVPISESDRPAPEDPYGISKHEAEQGLLQIAASSAMEVVIIRPPLVYGHGVRANFRSLVRAVALGVPLPFGAVQNCRSLVSLDNLVDFIMCCIEHRAAANEVFLVSDGDDISTQELIRRLGRAMGRRVWLFQIPVPLLMAGAVMLGEREKARRVLGSFQADISKARRLLGWKPPLTVDEGLQQAAQLS